MKINLTKKDIKELIAAVELIHEREAEMTIEECAEGKVDTTCWYVYIKKKLNASLNSKANKK